MRSALAGAALLAAAACTLLPPVSDGSRYYTLRPGTSRAALARPAVAAIGVGPVRLPPYLDRAQIVTRAGPERLDIAPLDRWAAPLDVLFLQALAEDLRDALPAREVLTWPWSGGATLDWTVAVDVQRFEREPDGTAVLEARWVLSRRAGAAERGTSRIRRPATAPEMTASVAALSEAVADLAAEVAGALARAPAPAVPPRADPAPETTKPPVESTGGPATPRAGST